jgi:hypothetical protein
MADAGLLAFAGMNERRWRELNEATRNMYRQQYAAYQAGPAVNPPPPTLAPAAPAPTASNSTEGNSAFDPQGQMAADWRQENPFASYSNILGGQGINTSTPQASAFNQWVNNEGWSGIENDYKKGIAADPWAATSDGGSHLYDWLGDVPSPTNFSQMTGIESHGGLADTLRLRYNQMTPQQRGVNSATGFKPSRWAVF